MCETSEIQAVAMMGIEITGFCREQKKHVVCGVHYDQIHSNSLQIFGNESSFKNILNSLN